MDSAESRYFTFVWLSSWFVYVLSIFLALIYAFSHDIDKEIMKPYILIVCYALLGGGVLNTKWLESSIHQLRGPRGGFLLPWLHCWMLSGGKYDPLEKKYIKVVSKFECNDFVQW